MPIDWSQVGDVSQAGGAIDWGTVAKSTLLPREQIAAQINNDAISQGARDFTNQRSDALGGVSQYTLDLLNAVGHNAIKPLHGAAQLVQNIVAPGADSTKADNAAIQQWEQQYQKNTPDNPASYVGAGIGSALPLLAGGITSGLQSAGDYVASKLPAAVTKFAPNLLPKVVSAGTQGAIVAATNPVDTGANGVDFLAQKGKQVGVGGAVGGSVPVVAAGAQGLWNAAAPLVNPKKVVANALQRMGVTPDALSGAELVPGSLPTTAEVVANPQVVAAQKALMNDPAIRPQFEARNIANNDARWAVINGIAQTPEALSAAVQDRAAQTAPLQAALLKNGNPVTVNGIVDQLDSLAKSSLGARPTIAAAANDLKQQILANAQPNPNNKWMGTNELRISPDYLDALRQNAKDYLVKHAPNGIVPSQQQAALEPVRSAIVDAIEGANPGYRDYLAKYAQLSQPINTMEAAQSIVDNLGSRANNASNTPQLSLGGINTQLRQIGNTQYGVSPQAQKSLEAVQADLQRATTANGLRFGGSDTAYNLQAPNWLGSLLYGNNFQGSKTLGVLGRGAGLGLGWATGGPFGAGTGYVTGALAGKALSDTASKNVNEALAKALLNPEVAREILLREARPPSAALQGLLDRVPQLGLVAPRGLLAPATQ